MHNGHQNAFFEVLPFKYEAETEGSLRGEFYLGSFRYEENEFRLNRLPAKVQQQFNKGGPFWRAAVAEAILAGIRNPNDLADLIFFMQFPMRIQAGLGQPIDRREPDFVKLRAEWNLYRTIATGLLTPAGARPACGVFLPANPSRNYEDYVAAPTTGRITLMVNGRSNDIDQTEAFDSMQETVESLGPNDSIFLANWQFHPASVPLTKKGSAGTWADLFKSKANQGVRIRIIISDLGQVGVRTGFQTNLAPLNKIIGELPLSARDNFKYIFSQHPPALPVIGPLEAHHQKFMVVKKGGTTIAYCGGLDISFSRTPGSIDPNTHKLDPHHQWGPDFVWHDIHAKLEGLIAKDIEREFILRWNREKDGSTANKLPGWKDLETLAQTPVSSVDKEPSKNMHKLQMLRTVSVGLTPADIRRDDIWQAYFRLIGCATRFIFMENQYFHEPRMADAIVKQAQAQPDLIVIIVVSSGTDDPTQDPYVQHCLAVRNEFFTRLFKGIPSTRRRVYQMYRQSGLLHSKLILVDDQALSMGSANANPRGFFLDTELNVMLDDAETVKSFRHRLWSHDLGVPLDKVKAWAVSKFIDQWDAVANDNDMWKTTPGLMKGERIIPYDPTAVKGKRGEYRLAGGLSIKIQDGWC